MRGPTARSRASLVGTDCPLGLVSGVTSGIGSVQVPSREEETMRRLALVLVCAFLIAAIAAASAGARTSKSAFLVFVEPTISKASNGLTLETELAGTFNVANKTASGDGTYAVM